MDLVPIAEPQSESELAVMLSLLEADNIPAFVQGGGIGGLLPGPQIGSYNTRRIVVPGSCEEQARAALVVLLRPNDEPAPPTTSWRDKLRMFLEAFLLGWFVPGGRSGKDASRDAP
jgi:hypothetical protein